MGNNLTQRIEKAEASQQNVRQYDMIKYAYNEQSVQYFARYKTFSL